MELASQHERVRTAQSHQHFKSFIARQITKHAGIVRVVLDDQQYGIVGLQILAVVGNLLHRVLRYGDIR